MMRKASKILGLFLVIIFSKGCLAETENLEQESVFSLNQEIENCVSDYEQCEIENIDEENCVEELTECAEIVLEQYLDFEENEDVYDSGRLVWKLIDSEVWWRNLSQQERNEYIIYRALQDWGETGHTEECKNWVRNVVKEASGGWLNIPSNCSDWYWCNNNYHQYTERISRLIPIFYAQSGEIVQMRVRDKQGRLGPHTAIVWFNYGSGVCFIDNNWNRDFTVRVHCESFYNFLSMTSAHSVYRITGGG